jgi:hypothetical protein
MHTLTLNIQDNVFQEFLNFISTRKETIKITTDKNLELDPYFYERQQELQQTRNDIKNGNIEMISHETLWGNIKNHLKTIETK